MPEIIYLSQNHFLKPVFILSSYVRVAYLKIKPFMYLKIFYLHLHQLTSVLSPAWRNFKYPFLNTPSYLCKKFLIIEKDLLNLIMFGHSTVSLVIYRLHKRIIRRLSCIMDIQLVSYDLQQHIWILGRGFQQEGEWRNTNYSVWLQSI